MLDEPADLDLTQILNRLREAFPSLAAREDLRRRSHAEWVELRSELHCVPPSEIPIVLPFILSDMAQYAEGSRFASGDMVLYFLDVRANRPAADNPVQRELIEKFAAEHIGGSAGERFKQLMFDPLPACESCPTSGDELASRESSFANLTVPQSREIYYWLRYVDQFYQPYEVVRMALWSAMTYWYARGL